MSCRYFIFFFNRMTYLGNLASYFSRLRGRGKKNFNYLTPSVDCDTGRSKYRCKQIPRWQAATAPKLRSVTANPRCYRSREVWRDDTDLGFPSRSRVTRLPPYNNPYSLSSHSLASAKRAARGGRGGRVRGCREETQLPPSGRCV